jgi:3-carboxy-cis,cis-muconate cycloisomerase
VKTVCARVVSSGTSLADELGQEAAVRQLLTATQIGELLDPAGYLGSSELFIDRAVQAHEDRRQPGAEGAAQPPVGQARPSRGAHR